MIIAEIIKQISDGNNVYREGDKVEITMKDKYYKGHSDRKNKYIGVISMITEDGGFLDYENISMPFDVDDIECIKKVNAVNEFCKEFEEMLYSRDVDCGLKEIQTVVSAMKELQDRFS
jgi:protein associated with RNAse G/E